MGVNYPKRSYEHTKNYQMSTNSCRKNLKKVYAQCNKIIKFIRPTIIIRLVYSLYVVQ